MVTSWSGGPWHPRTGRSRSDRRASEDATIKPWRRKADGDEAAASAAGPTTPPADDDGTPTLRTLGSMGQLGPSAIADEEDRAARYNDWAERMREKRRRTQAMQQGGRGDGDNPTYWSTDALFEESRRVDQEELHTKPNPWRISELLAVLDLREGASTNEISDAYRKLAKTHHPDKFVEAEEDIREFHAERMREINTAYKALRTLEKSGT